MVTSDTSKPISCWRRNEIGTYAFFLAKYDNLECERLSVMYHTFLKSTCCMSGA
jgi:hypothetical protein